MADRVALPGFASYGWPSLVPGLDLPGTCRDRGVCGGFGNCGRSGSGQRLNAARQAVETAKAEVARLEAAKARAIEESDRMLASANEKLRDTGQNSDPGSPPAETNPEEQTGPGVTEEEADRLRAEVQRAIQDGIARPADRRNCARLQ